MENTEETDVSYSVSKARYAKGMMLVRAPSTDGFKNREARLLTALNFRWTNRENGYVGSPTKVAKFMKLHAEGWDANYISLDLVPPKGEGA